jgi:hypothetical protein
MAATGPAVRDGGRHSVRLRAVLERRRIAKLIAAVAAAALLATGCGDKQSAAVRVDDQTVSQSDLYEELHLIATNAPFRDATLGTSQDGSSIDPKVLRGDLAGSYSQPFVGAVLGQRVLYLLADDVLAKNDLHVTAADRQAIIDQLDRLLPKGAGELPANYRRDFVEGLARLRVLQTELGSDQANLALREQAADSDIVVASQFGHWDVDQLTVVPPEGPTASSRGSASTDTSGTSGGGAGAGGQGSSSG